MEHLRNLNYTWGDLQEAGADYLAARLGIPSATPHPVAERMVEDEVSLLEMASTLGHTLAARNGATYNNLRAANAAINAGALTTILNDATSRLVHVTYDNEADHRRIALLTPVRDFMPVDFPMFDVDDELPKISELAQIPQVVVTPAGGESAKLSSFGVRLGITREMIINDDLDLLRTTVRRLTASASRLEGRHVFGVLEENPTLADGDAMFNADAGNLLSSTPFGKAGLSAAVAALRRQKTISGDESNNAPAFLVVPPEMEIEALELVAALTLQRAPVQVIATPELSASNWYLMAEPEKAPVVGLLRLRGATERSVAIIPEKKRLDFDGVSMKFIADLGATALSRVGAIKATA